MSTELLQTLREAEVIPQVIPEDQANSIKCAVKVVYPNTTISLGEKPARRDVLEIPEIEFPEAVSSFTPERRPFTLADGSHPSLGHPRQDPSASYTIICTDPDLLMRGEQTLGPVSETLEFRIPSSRPAS